MTKIARQELYGILTDVKPDVIWNNISIEATN